MSTLDSLLITGRKMRPPRVMLYGPQGIGKNTFAASCPSPVIIQAEEGSDELGTPRLPLLKSYDDAIAQLTMLCKEQHAFQTVVIDTLDWLEKLVWADVCAKHNVDSIEKVEKGYGKGYVIALNWWRKLLDGLKFLRDERGMIVLLLAHTEIKRFDSPETEPYDRFQPRLNQKAAGMVMEWSDAVLFANYRTFTTKSEVGFNKEVRRAIGTGERVLHTCERPSHHAKNRFGLPTELPFPNGGGWQHFVNAVAASHAAASPPAGAIATALASSAGASLMPQTNPAA